MKLRSASLLLFAVLATSCAGLLEPAAAVVSGEKITVAEVQAAVDDFEESQEFQRLAQQGDAPAIVRDFEQSYITTLIRRAVLGPKAAELGVEVSPGEVNDQLEQIKGEFPSDSAFQEALKEQGLTLEQLELLVRDRELEERLREEITAAEAPPEAELRSYYEEHLDDFEETATSHILVEERPLATQISNELRAAPRRALDALFTRLAKRHSQDRSNKDIGGALGFNRPGQFVPPFEAAAAELDAGEISRPVKTRFGWHVIWVTDRRPAPFEQVREEVQAEVGLSDDEIWEQWLIGVYEEAGVKVNPRYGEFNVAAQQVEDVSARTVPGAQETPRVEQPSPDPTDLP